MTKKNPTLARTLLALAVLALASYSLASASPSEEVMAYDDDGRGQHQQVKITNVPGYFVQDLDETDPALFDYAKSNFGLVERLSWQAFRDEIDRVNCPSSGGGNYRVLFLARHGQGFHNLAEEYYGKTLWDVYWSKLDGNGSISWDDAELTPKGIEEAHKANMAWKAGIRAGMPLPQRHYSSPMRRAASTLQITWSDIPLDDKHSLKPLIKEGLRETLGVHTCDRRHKRSEIAKMYPNFAFEHGFSEDDTLWLPDVRETNGQRNVRLAAALQQIVATDASTYIAISAHSGAIMSILEVIGHRPFPLQTGGIMPVVVRVERAGTI